MVGEERSDDTGTTPAVLVDVAPVRPIPVPTRRTLDGAVVADWGQVPARVYVAGLSGDGRRTMTACLAAIAAWVSGGAADIDTLPWAALRFTHTTAIRAALARAVTDGRYAPATANKHIAALRGALKAAWRLGTLATDDYLRAVDLRPVPGSRLPAGRNVEHDELAALLAVCAADPRPAGARDAAIIALAYLSGGRRAELAGLHLADLDLDPPAIRVVGAASNAWCPSPPPSPRLSSAGWPYEAPSRDRCSAPSTGATTSSSTAPSVARPSARSWAGAAWPPGSKPSHRTICAAAMPEICSMPEPIFPPSNNSWATPLPPPRPATTAAGTRPVAPPPNGCISRLRRPAPTMTAHPDDRTLARSTHGGEHNDAPDGPPGRMQNAESGAILGRRTVARRAHRSARSVSAAG